MRSVSITITLGSLLLTVAPASGPAAEASDEGIRDAVESELILSDAVFSTDITVIVDDGTVFLTGSVPNVLAKRRAGRLAGMVSGVGAVANEITVAPPPRRDSAIERDVERALLADPAADGYAVTVGVDDGVVTLGGTAESWQERRLAELAAAGVRGVRAVENGIEVVWTEDRLDTEIAADIRQAFAWHPHLDDHDISVAVADGTVVLSGTVDSLHDYDLAQRKAWVYGVTAVDADELAVDATSSPLARPQRTAADIAVAIESALATNPLLADDEIEVSVVGSRATLEGSVDTLQQRSRAEWYARLTSGVSEVTNLLVIDPPLTIEDSALATTVRAALRRDAYLGDDVIQISASAGAVTLTGTVDSSFEYNHAEDIVSGLYGVRSIENQLVVDRDVATLAIDYYDVDDALDFGIADLAYADPDFQTEASDAEIAEAIAAQLSWSPFIDADAIEVSVENGIATLTGTVDDWVDITIARDNAFEGGAISVIDRLTVDTDA